MNMVESKLLPTLSSIGRFSSRDVADLCFLYFVALHTLRANMSSERWAEHYAAQTQSTWYAFTPSSTDLHQLISILLEHRVDLAQRLKNTKTAPALTHTLDEHDVKRFLANVKSTHYNSSEASRSLMRFETQLHITTTNYRSVRRICSDWTKPWVTDEAKSLALTRLIQAISARASNSDLLPQLQAVAHEEKLLLRNVCNPETGAGCDAGEAKLSLLKKLAIATGIGVGAFMLGRALAKGMNE